MPDEVSREQLIDSVKISLIPHFLKGTTYQCFVTFQSSFGVSGASESERQDSRASQQEPKLMHHNSPHAV